MFKIVVLTGFEDIFYQFQQSMDLYASEIPRIVVTSRGVTPKLIYPQRWKVVRGDEPFIFSRNANLGIAAAGESDVLLMNDDVQFSYIGKVEMLPTIAHENPKIGILSPQIIGSVGTREQRCTYHNDQNPFFLQKPLRFVCVYLKRSVLNKIGPLDERFTGYGGDDEDYSRRILEAGYLLAVTSSIFVMHGFQERTATSSFMRTLGEQKKASSQDEMQALLKEKWEPINSPLSSSEKTGNPLQPSTEPT